MTPQHVHTTELTLRKRNSHHHKDLPKPDTNTLPSHDKDSREPSPKADTVLTSKTLPDALRSSRIIRYAHAARIPFSKRRAWGPLHHSYLVIEVEIIINNNNSNGISSEFWAVEFVPRRFGTISWTRLGEGIDPVRMSHLRETTRGVPFDDFITSAIDEGIRNDQDIHFDQGEHTDGDDETAGLLSGGTDSAHHHINITQRKNATVTTKSGIWKVPAVPRTVSDLPTIQGLIYDIRFNNCIHFTNRVSRFLRGDKRKISKWAIW